MPINPVTTHRRDDSSNAIVTEPPTYESLGTASHLLAKSKAQITIKPEHFLEPMSERNGWVESA